MLEKKGKRVGRKIIWLIATICFFVLVFIIGKFNSGKNDESLHSISEAKKYFEDGDLAKAKENFVKVNRKGIIDYYPEYKEFYSIMKKVVSDGNNSPIEILGSYNDKFIEDKAYLILNSVEESKSFKKPFLKIKGWVPKIDTLFPMTIKLEFKDKSFTTATIYQDGFFEVDVPINDIQNIQNGDMIKVQTDRYYSPKMLNMGDDSRNLSVQLNEVKIFDYANEQKNFVVKGLYNDNWMGKNIDIDIRNSDEKTKGLKISADIPQQIKVPFNVVIRSSSEIVQVIKVDKVGESQIDIILPEDLLKSEIVQFSVTAERTYNPKELGINKDERDLSLNIKKIDLIY